MQDTVDDWVNYFVREYQRRAQDNRLNEEAVRDLAELAFFRTDAGFLDPERAAAVYVKESKSPVPATPWMLDLRALTSASRDMALAGR